MSVRSHLAAWNARYQQLWFRYGQLAMRAGRPWLNPRRLLEPVVPDADVAPGLMVVQKDGERSRIHLWLGALLYGQPTDTVDGEVVLEPQDHGPARTLRVPLHWFSLESEKA